MAKNSAETMQQARSAIRKGKLAEARRLLRQLVRDDPQNHVAWLLLARATPSSTAALEYVQRAELLRPDSLLVHRARAGLEQKMNGNGGRSHTPSPRLRTAILFGGLALLVALLAAWVGPLAWQQVSALRNDKDAEVAIVPRLAPTMVLNSQSEAILIATPTLQPTPTARPTAVAEPDTVTVIEGSENSEEAGAGEAADVQDQESPPVLIVEEVEEVVPEDPTGLRPPGVAPGERWIDVSLNMQSLVAYEGNTPVYSSLVSSGTQDFPTITGQYRTYMKYETQDMNGYAIGYDYYLQDVPYVMYFSGNFAIHGAYWHHNFGVPMSHGCINVSPVDAGWLYNWAPVGTTVNIHE
jgi:lipoprotein-anchoring transpeptidase ErfK/SrfK